jgi:hypothetical protein
MKKFIQIVTATILAAGLIGNIASAVTTAPCSGSIAVVDNSGNHDTVNVSCITITHTTITCTNTGTVANINYQDGKTGTAVVTGNESDGYAISGKVINTNNTNTTIDASCAAPATPAVTTSPSVTPVTPGKGATVAAASLPNTASNSTATVIAVSLASAAAVVGLSRAGVAAYRRFGNK